MKHPKPAPKPVKLDASLDVALNGAKLADGTVVPWAVAFPRP